MNEMIGTEPRTQSSRPDPLRLGSCSIINFLCDSDQATHLFEPVGSFVKEIITVTVMNFCSLFCFVSFQPPFILLPVTL